ncbi:NAD(P)-dependent oxidoreductase [Mycobacterium sp. PS03-16]|uniref:NAD-dependent epimerase/dehydratase family protein n=1 Tax=Mycobacterium sp. PS03-16 TaxID=2559611 RepID=UPI001073E8C3|nr:NAD(P)-dependent oxidoreductase [Mycobacterium sp. PS03-16]TFV55051.1 NAD(P)-dependent oxidoreductase [Mycobacterium sp. PS03-16]
MITVAVTGAAGTVGRAVTTQLRDRFAVVGIDRPAVDILTDRDALAHALHGSDVVVHLAYDPGGPGPAREDWRAPARNPVNAALFDAVLDTARRVGTGLFLHASSVHVEDTLAWARAPRPLLRALPEQFETVPASGYGRAKRDEEARLRAAARQFRCGAVSLRLGGVTADDRPLRHHDDPAVLDHERRVWLAHADLGDLLTAIIDTRREPGFDTVYAVSDNPGRFHDVSNRYGWTPRQSSGTGSGHVHPDTTAGVHPPMSR